MFVIQYGDLTVFYIAQGAWNGNIIDGGMPSWSKQLTGSSYFDKRCWDLRMWRASSLVGISGFGFRFSGFRVFCGFSSPACKVLIAHWSNGILFVFCLGSETSAYRKIQQGFRASCLQATKKGMFGPKLRGTVITTAIESWQIEYLWIGARDGLQKIQQLVIVPEHLN